MKLTILLTLAWLCGSAPNYAGTAETYIVLYKGNDVPKDAGKIIAKAGGVLVKAHDPIGVAIARSGEGSFRQNLLAADSRVDGAASTTRYAINIANQVASVQRAGATVNSLALEPDESLVGLQWDMAQIH